MAKKEVKTNLWVAAQLDECNIQFDAQGSNVKELDDALKTASKRGTGNAGYPEYVAVIDDFVLVVEDKADLELQISHIASQFPLVPKAYVRWQQKNHNPSPPHLL